MSELDMLFVFLTGVVVGYALSVVIRIMGDTE